MIALVSGLFLPSDYVEANELNYETYEEKHDDVFIVTAYTANAESTGKSPGHPAYGITASGKRVEDGVTIACPPELPFGTRVEIEGVGERICTDRGGAIKGKRIDLYIARLDDALEFGRQELRVRILENGGDVD